MYNVLVKVIIGAALLQLGLTFKDIGECSSRACISKLQKASQQVLHIDWRPISMFPEVASHLRKSGNPTK